MNWRGGLLRLWVGVAALWVLTVGTFTIMRWFEELPIPYVATEAECIPDNHPGWCNYRAEAAAVLQAQNWRRDNWFFTGLTLIPPTLILAIGSAVFWAMAGFGKK